MEIINHSINETIYLPSSLKSILSDDSFCILDIETTGFNRVKDKIVLIGLLYMENNIIRIIQLFAEDLEDELVLLDNFKNIITNFKYIITYNGDAFDIPFINTKFDKHNINFNLDKTLSIDLMRLVRDHKSILGLKSYRLKSVETYLGITREDKITGKESVDLYLKFIKNKDINTKSIILQHNYDDIYYLSKILKIYDVIKARHSIELSLNTNHTSVPLTFEFDQLSIEGNMLLIHGSTNPLELKDQIYYDENFSVNWSPISGEMTIKLQVYEGLLSNNSKCYYIDKEDYAFNSSIQDHTDFQLPESILLIKSSNEFIHDHIQGFIKNLLLNIL